MLGSLLLALMLVTPTDQTVPVTKGTKLDVNNFAGDVIVKVWDKDAVRVEVNHSDREVVDIKPGEQTLSVRSRSVRGGPPRSLDYTITVPKWMAIAVSGTYADVTLDGVGGDVTIETTRGDIKVTGGSGFVSLKSVQGQIVLDKAKGHIEVRAINEGVRLADVSGDISAESTNGSLILDRIDSENVDLYTVNGNITFDGPIKDKGLYRLTTHNGTVGIAVPDKANAMLTVRTYNGGFKSSFPLKLDDQNPRKRFTVTLGTGSAHVELESFGGSIRSAGRVNPGPRLSAKPSASARGSATKTRIRTRTRTRKAEGSGPQRRPVRHQRRRPGARHADRRSARNRSGNARCDGRGRHGAGRTGDAAPDAESETGSDADSRPEPARESDAAPLASAPIRPGSRCSGRLQPAFAIRNALEFGDQLGDVLLRHRIDQRRRNLGERTEHEPAFAKSWVRNGQPRLVDHDVAKQNQIEIERPRRLRVRPFAPSRPFDRQQGIEECPRRHHGLADHRRVEEHRLWAGHANRNGVVKSRHGEVREQVAELRDRVVEVGAAVADVGAERDRDRGGSAHRRPIQSNEMAGPRRGRGRRRRRATEQVRPARQSLIEEPLLLECLAEHHPQHLGVARIAHAVDARPPPIHERLCVPAILFNHPARGLAALGAGLTAWFGGLSRGAAELLKRLRDPGELHFLPIDRCTDRCC